MRKRPPKPYTCRAKWRSEFSDEDMVDIEEVHAPNPGAAVVQHVVSLAREGIVCEGEAVQVTVDGMRYSTRVEMRPWVRVESCAPIGDDDA